jgi:hypothetical protein
VAIKNVPKFIKINRTCQENDLVLSQTPHFNVSKTIPIKLLPFTVPKREKIITKRIVGATKATENDSVLLKVLKSKLKKSTIKKIIKITPTAKN